MERKEASFAVAHQERTDLFVALRIELNERERERRDFPLGFAGKNGMENADPKAFIGVRSLEL